MSIDTFSPLTTTLIFAATIIAALCMLVWSADRFVNASASIAKQMGMSTFLIGLTIVALGTSAPEILVSSTAALSGNQGLAIGNAIGSNIANMGLVLGITALFASLPISSLMKKQEIPALLAVTLLTGLLISDHNLGVLDGIILLVTLVFLMFLVAMRGKNAPETIIFEEEVEEIDPLPLSQGSCWFIIALILLLVSSKMLVWGASGIAVQLGISEVIIGLTVVAIGTSLPELAASIASVLKGHGDLAIGNVVGSNIINMLAVLSLPGLIAPSAMEPVIFLRDYSTMLGLTVLMTLFTWGTFSTQRASSIGRIKGTILILVYSLYTGYLIYISIN